MRFLNLPDGGKNPVCFQEAAKVETIDIYGLKVRHLRKHRKSAKGFIEHVVAVQCATEAGLALKKRIEKNRGKLFTFLDHAAHLGPGIECCMLIWSMDRLGRPVLHVA
jgi:hypothetical protein